jgi:ferrochelatase
MKWLDPSVESVLAAAAAAGRRHVIVVPVAFVSEHSETLYELDILYGDIARGLGLGYTRVPTLQTHPGLIAALAEAVREAAR